ncbi:MAG TPA: hypothetical protein DCX07_06440 [Phycisphaerales bacterium]|nr:hypothetical protein [Phycisphaerales bacterium]
MSNQTGRFRWVVRVGYAATIVSLAILAVLLVGSVAMLVRTVLLAPSWECVGFWIAAILVEGLVAAGIFASYGALRVLVSNEYEVTVIRDRFDRIETLLSDLSESSRKLLELVSLSDRAKSLLFREQEIEAFREAVHDNLMKQDYNTAEKMIEMIEKDLGFTDEAQRLHEEVLANRKATLEEKIDRAIARIQQIIDRHDWSQALRETKRILRLFPKNEKVVALPDRIESARAAHKRDLLHDYGEAVRRNDVDRGIELLRELDRYLAPQEAAALQESARGVFRARLHNLGVQFAIRVTEKQWNEAISVGEEIISGFPNSRMASEVRAKMDQLRTRATQDSA